MPLVGAINKRRRLAGGRNEFQGTDAERAGVGERERRLQDEQLSRRGTYLEATVPAGSVTGWVSGTPQNIVSLPIPAGKWEVEGVSRWTGGPITGNGLLHSISTTSNTLNPSLYDRFETTAMPNATFAVQFGSSSIRVSGPTTVYLVGFINFSVGTPTVGGQLRARRAA